MKILQVSCSYLPGKVGGTETYLYALNKELLAKGHEVFVCYFDVFREKGGEPFRIKRYAYEGVSVFALEENIWGQKTQDIYFDDEDKAGAVFSRLLQETRPQVAHFHHFSSTHVITAMRLIKDKAIPIILSYHTPMMTCGQGHMLYCGRSPCKGIMDYRRCLFCVQMEYLLPQALAWCWSRAPLFVSWFLYKRCGLSGIKLPFATWLGLPWLTFRRMERMRRGLGMVNYFVAVSEWTRQLLLENGYKKENIFLCRQGVEKTPALKPREPHTQLKCFFVGRITPYKGLHILLKAVALLEPDIDIQVHIFGEPAFDCERKYLLKLKKRYGQDRRIIWRGLLDPGRRFEVMQEADLLVIPSLWLETGPLVLLEAWACRVPVIASNRGGIAELVNSGRGGLLFEAGDHRALAGILRRALREHGMLEGLGASISCPRTMQQVAADTQSIYEKILSERQVR